MAKEEDVTDEEKAQRFRLGETPGQLRTLLWHHLCFYRNHSWLLVALILLPMFIHSVVRLPIWLSSAVAEQGWVHCNETGRLTPHLAGGLDWLRAEDRRYHDAPGHPNSTICDHSRDLVTNLHVLGVTREVPERVKRRVAAKQTSLVGGQVLYVVEDESEAIQTVLDRVKEIAACLWPNPPHFKPFPSLQDLKTYARSQNKDQKKLIHGGILFQSSESVRQFSYALLHSRKEELGWQRTRGKELVVDPDTQRPYDYQSHALVMPADNINSRRIVQELVDTAILSLTAPPKNCSKPEKPPSQTEKEGPRRRRAAGTEAEGPAKDQTLAIVGPIPAGCRGGFTNIMKIFHRYFGLLAVVVSYFLPRAHFLTQILTEKELKLREYLYINGVTDVTLKLSWLLFYALVLQPLVVVNAVWIRFGDMGMSVYAHTDFGVFLVSQFLFAMASLAHVYIFAVLFQSPKGSAFILLIVDTIAALVSIGMFNTLEFFDQELAGTVVLCLMSPVFPYAVAHFYAYEWAGELDVGAHWSILYSSPNKLKLDGYGGMGMAWSFLFFDLFVYLGLGWYLERVFPGEFGVAQKPWFPFLPSFWRPPVEVEGEELAEDAAAGPPTQSPIGVELIALTKRYGPAKYGVRNLNLRFYQNFVTIFLGENGAGKSTTMNILVGLIKPTSGRAKVLGKEVTGDIASVRKLIGFVPQYDILYPMLTVKQHLKFFGWLKGMPWAAVEMEMKPLLMSLGMVHLMDVPTTALSGGQKRKLSVVTAFLGKPKVVILDEPTSGVDPFSRRALWELIQRKRSTVTIILSTHFMDEADLLGDRINIISTGKEVACGTPMQLKGKFGHGFRLVMALDPKRADKVVPGLVAFLRANTLGGSVLCQRGNDLTYALPNAFTRSKNMTVFLGLLEKQHTELGVSSFGLSEPSMDEVYFEAVELAEQGRIAAGGRTTSDTSVAKPDAPDEEAVQEGDPPDVRALKEATSSDQLHFPLKPSVFAQLVGLSQKKVLYTVRSPVIWFSQLVVPFCFTILGVYLGRRIMPDTDYDFSVPVNFHYPYRQDLAFLRGPLGSRLLGEYQDVLLDGGLPPICPSDDDCQPISDAARQSFQEATELFVNMPDVPLDPKDSSFKCSDSSKIQYTGPPTQKEGLREKLSRVRLASGTELYRLGRDVDLEDWVYQVSGPMEEVVFGLEAIPNLNFSFLDKHLHMFLRKGWRKDRVSKAVIAAAAKEGRNLLSSEAVVVWWGFAWRDLRRGMMQGAALNAFANVELRRRSGDPEAFVRFSSVLTDAFGVKSPWDEFYSLILVFLIALGSTAGTISTGNIVMDEVASGQKRIQMLYGAIPGVYWAVNFFFDLLLFHGTVLFVLLPFGFMDGPFDDALDVIVATVIPFGVQSLGFVYLWSFALTSNRGMQILLTVSNMVFLVVGSVTGALSYMALLCGSGPEETCDFAIFPFLGYVSRLHPIGFLCDTLAVTLMAHVMTEREGASWMKPGELPERNYERFDRQVFTWRIVQCAVLSVAQLVAVVVLEQLDLRCYCGCVRVGPDIGEVPLPHQDPDVLAEEQRLAGPAMVDEPLVVRGLKKRYPHAKLPAVCGISVGVPKGQCFGLLGINGAGKTTTFNMLTGALRPTDGEALLNGRDLTSEFGWTRFAGSSYCPQENTVFDGLSCRQSLRLVFRLRGVPSLYWRKLERLLMEETGLTRHADRRCEHLSGGNKRKLNLAMCLVGYVAVIFLDEPSSGMDPGARRRSWECVKRATERGCAIVLTSHSMEECEALCHRLTIMVAGVFQCLGSVQYLKGKYGQEYNFKIKLGGPEDPTLLKERIGKEITGCKLEEEHSKTLFYDIPAGNMPLSQLFQLLQGIQDTAVGPVVEDFSVSQTTLEHVFLRMALVQEQLQYKFGKGRSGGEERHGHHHIATIPKPAALTDAPPLPNPPDKEPLSHMAELPVTTCRVPVAAPARGLSPGASPAASPGLAAAHSTQSGLTQGELLTGKEEMEESAADGDTAASYASVEEGAASAATAASKASAFNRHPSK